MTERDKEIAVRAKEAMDRAGVNHNRLAKKIGKSAATVSDYLNGTIRIPVSVLVEIAELTGESIHHLATGGYQTSNGHSYVMEGIDLSEQRTIGMLRRLPEDSRQRLIDMITTAYFDHMESISDVK